MCCIDRLKPQVVSAAHRKFPSVCFFENWHHPHPMKCGNPDHENRLWAGRRFGSGSGGSGSGGSV
jgi:hypothetical protein